MWIFSPVQAIPGGGSFEISAALEEKRPAHLTADPGSIE